MIGSQSVALHSVERGWTLAIVVNVSRVDIASIARAIDAMSSERLPQSKGRPFGRPAPVGCRAGPGRGASAQAKNRPTPGIFRTTQANAMLSDPRGRGRDERLRERVHRRRRCISMETPTRIGAWKV